MARIISQVDPNTGRRTKIGSVEGRTIEERQSQLTNAFGITNREANKLSNSDIAARLGGPISTTSLTAQPSFDIQTQPPSTAVKGLLGQFEASGDQFSKQLQQQAEVSRNREATAFESLFTELAGQATPAQLTADAYKTDVDPLQKEVTGLNNQLLAEQHSLRRQQEAIEKNTQGLFGGQMQNELERVERESLKKQADIAVILNAKQGQLTDAKAIADRAVDAEIQYQQRKIDLLQMNYERNKSLFDKDEQRAFETAQADRNRALDFKEEQMKQMSDLSISALENGAPTSVVTAMRNAKDVTEALSIGGGYIGLLQRQAASRAASSAALARKKDLIELAALGDKSAMEELGIDPNAPDAEQRVKSQDEINRLDEEIARVNSMLANDVGLQTSSGAIRSPLLSSLGTGIGFGAPAGILSYTSKRDAQADFLSKANYVLTNLTTEKVTDLKNRGVAFSPMTDADIALIGRATGELEGYTIRDEANKVVGFTSEVGARNALGQVVETLTKTKDREFRKMISNTELSEIEDL